MHAVQQRAKRERERERERGEERVLTYEMDACICELMRMSVMVGMRKWIYGAVEADK